MVKSQGLEACRGRRERKMQRYRKLDVMGGKNTKPAESMQRRDAYGEDVDKELCFCDREVTERKE